MNAAVVFHRAGALRPSLRRLAVSRMYATHVDTPTPEESGPVPPHINRQYLSPYGWQDQQMRRNFGDPMHEREELYSMWAPDVPVHADPPTAVKQFLIATAGFVSFMFACKYILTPDVPAARRDYPFDGLNRELGGVPARTESEDTDG
ncbi:hypothetical protein FISHEDRAFT_74809 [Fistulina hepatica ATCC 64428]|uniref:Uncharacterized protein n=1 Tax=Fistulina hepatica ATCC 64428 TaxID=1128425 RepID=A0A0D7A8Z8_9AGAR|nr:hypothetical protein FISHEDRAFT_74809 [Fistulina hepatica ATCC 64428]